MTDLKRYAVECHGGGEGLGAPALAVFDIERQTAEFIVQMARLIKQHQIHQIERYDFRVWYFETDPRDDLNDRQRTAAEADPSLIELRDDSQALMRSEADRLCVTADRFRFLTYRKHCDDEIETQDQPIAALAVHFAIPWDFAGPDGYLQAEYGDEGEDPRFPRSDWQYEMANGDTALGYFLWLWHRHEAENIALPASAIGPVADCVERLTRNGVTDTDLDAMVHDLKSAEAASINNEGLSTQVRYLLEADAHRPHSMPCWPDGARKPVSGTTGPAPSLLARRFSGFP
ncbi:hypothetical protein [Azospirillum agricola]|uniref:hypothetical protein n=1 Tax=Azospirillum agricola TaxID=1720247 RepID=UPI000A0F3408|nr:hypothetical protein [Azospirillum agricola]SMH43442.1 hypothetical protein SAMN02982994_1898 [Azospirillum lipoferum]